MYIDAGERNLIAAEVEYTREKLLGELERARQVAEEAKNGPAISPPSLTRFAAKKLCQTNAALFR
jgi:hypothetical protein